MPAAGPLVSGAWRALFSPKERIAIKVNCLFPPITTNPETVQVVCTPFTAKSKERPTDSLFDAVRKHDTGVFGIKPFANNSIFDGDATLGNPHAEADDEMARITLRYILGTNCITAPIPGLISIPQVENMAKAVKERRELDLAEKAELKRATDEMWANLPAGYGWLKDWEYV